MFVDAEGHGTITREGETLSFLIGTIVAIIGVDYIVTSSAYMACSRCIM